MLVYSGLTMFVLLGAVSLAVDFGRVQTIKQDMQRAADSIALGAINTYVDSGYNIPTAQAAAYELVARNPVDTGSGYTPTYTFIPGTWDRSARTFSPSYAPGTPAVRVIVSRTAANSNAVPLLFGAAIGMSRVDVQANAIVTLIDDDTQPVAVPAISNPYLAGMPAGSTSPWGDSQTNATPYGVNGIAVVPGTWISFVDTSGTSSILPGHIPYFGPNGEATRPLHHGQNQDGSNWNIGPENGIGDAIMPAAAFMGVFLTDQPPTSRATPAMIDWTDPAMKDRATYDAVPVQAPFLIGDGKTSSGVVKRFQVPPGATRLYLGIWDGVVQSNNAGSLSATVKLKRSVRLVK